MKVRLGTREVDFPSAALRDDLRDSAALLADVDALRERLTHDGYLLLRGFHPTEDVLRARAAILAHLEGAGALPAVAEPPNMKGRREITHHVVVQPILEGPRVVSLFENLFAEPARTFDYKWLRATPPGEFTGVHADSVYMGRGSQRLLSCWVPFGEVTPERGAIALCLGSEQGEGYAGVRRTYGQSDNDRDAYGGWLTLDPLELAERFGGQWQTTTFAPGDVLIFGMQMLHASLVNDSDEYRLTCDIRFQPASEPIDDRWVGLRSEERKRDDGPRVATPEMRARWGI